MGVLLVLSMLGIELQVSRFTKARSEPLLGSGYSSGEKVMVQPVLSEVLRPRVLYLLRLMMIFLTPALPCEDCLGVRNYVAWLCQRLDFCWIRLTMLVGGAGSSGVAGFGTAVPVASANSATIGSQSTLASLKSAGNSLQLLGRHSLWFGCGCSNWFEKLCHIVLKASLWVSHRRITVSISSCRPVSPGSACRAPPLMTVLFT